MKEIQYPKFLKLAQYVEDLYWKHILQDMAYNTCPSGTYIEKNIVYSCHTLKDNRFAFDLSNKELNENTANQLVCLLRSKLNLSSSIENLARRENLNVELKCTYSNWKEIKKKNIRDILLENYIIRLMHENNLTIKEGQTMLKHLNLQIYFKILQPSNIIYNSALYRIESIQNFNYMDVL